MPHQARRAFRIDGRSLAIAHQGREGIFGLRHAGIRPSANELHGAGISVGGFFVEGEKAEVIRCGILPRIGRLCQQRLGACLVPRHAAPLERHHAERISSVAIAALSREREPLRGLLQIGSDAETVTREFAEKRHGGGIVVILLDPFGRLAEGIPIMAALISAEGEIGGFAGRREGL